MKHASAAVLEKDTDDLLSALRRAETERTRATILSMLIGSIVGWAIGVGQLVIMGSWDLFYWPFMSLIPFYSGLGWALFGMILGGSGLFSKSKSSSKSAKEYQDSNAA